MRRILLALALVALITSSSSAVTKVWWELESSNCGATAVGGSGAQLVITPVTVPSGAYTFDLVMKISNDWSTSTLKGVSGYGINLWKMPGSAMSISNPAAGVGDEATWGNLTGTPSWTFSKTGNVNNGQLLLDNYSRAKTSAELYLNASNSPRLSIRVQLSAPTLADLGDVYESVSSALFGILPATANYVGFGDNTDVAGTAAVSTWAGVTGRPVIKFIPEPATLTLLGLGLLGLIRRR